MRGERDAGFGTLPNERGIPLPPQPGRSDGTAGETDEAVFFAGPPQVVTVTRLAHNPLEIPAAVIVIDRRMRDSSGVITVPDLLRHTAMFLVLPPYSLPAVVNYHGMSDESARHVQLLADGCSVNATVFGRVERPLLAGALEDAARLEMSRGPSGVNGRQGPTLQLHHGHNRLASSHQRVQSSILFGPVYDLTGVPDHTVALGGGRAGGQYDVEWRHSSGPGSAAHKKGLAYDPVLFGEKMGSLISTSLGKISLKRTARHSGRPVTTIYAHPGL